MSIHTNTPLRRSFAGLSAGLLLASLGTVALGSTAAAAPPQPTATISATCENRNSSPYIYQRVDYTVTAAYKGRWVDFTVTATVADAVDPTDSNSYTRHDSSIAVSNAFIFNTYTFTVPSAHVEVQVYDKGAAIGAPVTTTIDPITCS